MRKFTRCFTILSLLIIVFSCVTTEEAKKSDATAVKMGQPAAADPDVMTAVIQLGHSDCINSVAVSPDSRYIVSGSSDKTIKIWETTTGREIKTFRGHAKGVNSVVFSSDGKTVLSGSDDKTLRLWDVRSGLPIRTFSGHVNKVKSVAFCPNKKEVLSGSTDYSLMLWDTATAKRTRLFKRHWNIESISVSPDGKTALSAGWDETVKVWNLSSGKNIQDLKEHRGPVYAVSFSPDGKAAVSGGKDGRVILWDVERGEKIRDMIGHDGSVLAVSFSLDGRTILSGGEDGTVRMWDAADGRAIHTFKGHTQKVCAVAFSPDGRFAVSGGDDDTIRLWDVSAKRERLVFKGRSTKVLSVDVARDGGKIISELNLFDLESINLVRAFGQSTICGKFSPDGEYILSPIEGNKVGLWRVKTGRKIQSFEGNKDWIWGVDFSPDSTKIASGSDDGCLTIWNVSNGKVIQQLCGHQKGVLSINFSPDSELMATGSDDKTVKIWRIADGKEIAALNGHKRSVKCVTFSPDGQLLASGGATGCNDILLWDVASSRLLRTLTGHTNGVESIAFSPDGRYLVSGSADQTLKIWDVATGQIVRTLTGHMGIVSSVAFSKDGINVLSGGWDATTRIWNVNSGEEVVKILFSNDGEWIICTPDGYYDNSLEGTGLVHWAFPQALETFSFEQFESLFKRPEIIKARLSGDSNAGKPAPDLTRPPRIEMADHFRIKQTAERNYRLNCRAFSEKKVRSVGVFVNGKPFKKIPVDAREKDLTLDVPLHSSSNKITVIAYDENGFSSNPKSVDVLCTNDKLEKPDLYVFAVGVSDYVNMPVRWQLDYAHTDAMALTKALHKQEGKMFNGVFSKVLTNSEATVPNIVDTINVLSETSEKDVVVIFMAGHGTMAEDGKFYFLTGTGTFEDPANGGVDWSILGEAISRIKGTVIIFLDACHSGSIVTETVVPNDALAQSFFQKGHGGVMVFSASKGRQSSLETPDIGDGFGIFTYSLVQGLVEESKKADNNTNGSVEFMELVKFTVDKVSEISMGEQTPWLSRKELFGDVPIALVGGKGE